MGACGFLSYITGYLIIISVKGFGDAIFCGTDL